MGAARTAEPFLNALLEDDLQAFFYFWVPFIGEQWAYNEIFFLWFLKMDPQNGWLKKKNYIRMDEFWMITNGETSIFHQLDMNS